MRAALAQVSMALWRAKHRKAAIFRRKMSGFEVFLGLREYEVRSNPCLMPICRATHKIKSQAFLRKFAEGQAFFQLRRILLNQIHGWRVR